MKYSIYLITLYLAAAGLSSPAPIHNERDLQFVGESVVSAASVELSDGDLEKRGKKKPPTPPKPITTKKDPDPKTTKASQAAPQTSTTNKPSSSSSSLSSSSNGGTSKSSTATSTAGVSKSSTAISTGATSKSSTATSAGTSKSATGTSSAAACTRSAKPKPGAKNPRGVNDNEGSLCEQENYIDFGNGWRTPTKNEQKEAKVKTPYDQGKAPEITYRSMDVDFPEPPKVKPSWGGKPRLPAEDCPTSEENVIEKQKMDAPPENGMLFYSAVDAKEHEWATAQRRGFEFMLDIIKEDAKKWVQYAMGCKQIWPYVSKAAALLAKGDVHVLLPSKTFEVGEKPVWPPRTRPDRADQSSVWEDHEWPTLLQKSKEACRIWRWLQNGSAQPELLAVNTGGNCSPDYVKEPKGAAKKTYNWTTKTLS